MAVKKFDVLWEKEDPRPERKGKRVWVKLGVAFMHDDNKNGQLLLRIDSIPLDDNGRPVYPKQLVVFTKRESGTWRPQPGQADTEVPIEGVE